MELEKKRMEELRKAVVDLIEMERRYPPFDLFYLMIFPLPNIYDMWVRSIICPMAMLPRRHRRMVMMAWVKPVGSKEKMGRKYLASMVKMGWKMYIGRVLRPM